MRVKTFWCPRERKVGFHTELEAKMALATRLKNENGEKRYYPCYAGGKKHFHLTSQEKRDAAA